MINRLRRTFEHWPISNAAASARTMTFKRPACLIRCPIYGSVQKRGILGTLLFAPVPARGPREAVVSLLLRRPDQKSSDWRPLIQRVMEHISPPLCFATAERLNLHT